MTGTKGVFNAACEGTDCVGDVKITLGSSGFDYELDPTNPTFHRMVIFGGRGWSIFELPENPNSLLKLVFDSGDDAERTSCKLFPWAYNSKMDEEFAPGKDMPNNTLWRSGDDDLREAIEELNDPAQKGCADQGDGTPGACPLSATMDKTSVKDGPAFENIVVGEACGRLVAVTATEKNSIAWLYDITDLESPQLKKVFHLSPASETKSPGVAYNDGSLGEVDPESFFFLSPQESPSGKAAIMFEGAFSGTVSFWEFECVEEDTVQEPSSASRMSILLGPVLVLIFLYVAV